jgi:hypothetical protein
MARFRKRPVEVDALQFEPSPTGPGAPLWALQDWLDEMGAAADGWFIAPDRIKIPTPEGVMTARPGDWIIRGIHGEFYPCKPDIFDQTYEPVTARSSV